MLRPVPWLRKSRDWGFAPGDLAAGSWGNVPNSLQATHLGARGFPCQRWGNHPDWTTNWCKTHPPSSLDRQSEQSVAQFVVQQDSDGARELLRASNRDLLFWLRDRPSGILWHPRCAMALCRRRRDERRFRCSVVSQARRVQLGSWVLVCNGLIHESKVKAKRNDELRLKVSSFLL